MEIQVELAYEFHKFIKIQCSYCRYCEVLWRALCERVFEVFLIISQPIALVPCNSLLRGLCSSHFKRAIFGYAPGSDWDLKHYFVCDNAGTRSWASRERG